jgi:hypothetical protein
MNPFCRDPFCPECNFLTSGDCGKHGPMIVSYGKPICVHGPDCALCGREERPEEKPTTSH